MTRPVRLLLLAILSLASLLLCTLPVPASQNDCRIGTVDPEAYRRIAAEVAQMPEVDWAAVHRQWAEIEARAARLRTQGIEGIREAQKLPRREEVLGEPLAERLRLLLGRYGRTDEKIAAMHALMRSIGAEFTSAFIDPESPSPSGFKGKAHYYYKMDANQTSLYRPVCRWLDLGPTFLVSSRNATIIVDDISQVRIRVPNCFEDKGYQHPTVGICPKPPIVCQRGCWVE